MKKTLKRLALLILIIILLLSLLFNFKLNLDLGSVKGQLKTTQSQLKQSLKFSDAIQQDIKKLKTENQKLKTKLKEKVVQVDEPETEIKPQNDLWDKAVGLGIGALTVLKGFVASRGIPIPVN